MPRQLDSRVAVVTGGSSGIGRAAAVAFARAGAKVVIASRGVAGGEETVRSIRDSGGDAVFVQTDVTRAPDIEALMAATVQTFGRLDCAFFNNAGTTGSGLRLAEHTEEAFDHTIATNLKSVWLCMKHEILQMLTQGGGAIVNCASTAGLFGAPVGIAYVASKHGVVGMSRAAAREYAKDGIRVNAVCRASSAPPWSTISLATIQDGKRGPCPPTRWGGSDARKRLARPLSGSALTRRPSSPGMPCR